MSVEEELARRAIAQIGEWLKEEREAGRKGAGARLAIKFCGGCNPLIERRLLAEMVRKGLAGAVNWVPWQEAPDFVLIINGCLTACADRTEVEKKARAVLEVHGQGISAVENLGERGKG